MPRPATSLTLTTPLVPDTSLFRSPARNLADAARLPARRAADLAMRSPALDAPHAAVAAWRVAAANRRHRIARRTARALHQPRSLFSRQCPNPRDGDRDLGGTHALRDQPDRKSTRLNSSH